MKLKLFTFLVVLGTNVLAQTSAPRTSSNTISFGLHLGMNKAFTSITYSPYHSFESISLSSGIGPSLGVDVFLRMNKRLSVRASLPTIMFSQRTLRYQAFNSTNVVQHQIESVYGAASLALEYSLPRRMHNHQWYLSSGFMYASDFASLQGRHRSASLPQVGLNSDNYFLSNGAGLKLYRKYVTVSPEIGFHYGLQNVINPHNSIYTNAISSFRSHFLTFTLRFR